MVQNLEGEFRLFAFEPRARAGKFAADSQHGSTFVMFPHPRGYVGNAFKVPDVVKTVVRGAPLSKTLMDFGTMPPSIVMDALYAAMIKEQGALASGLAVMK